MTYDQWKTRSPDDERGRYLCGSHLRECGNTVSIPHDLCEECLEELAAEESMMDFFRWEPESHPDARDGTTASRAVAPPPLTPKDSPDV